MVDVFPFFNSVMIGESAQVPLLWICLLIVPLAMIAVAVLAMARNKKLREQAREHTVTFRERLTAIPDTSPSPAERLNDAFADVDNASMQEAVSHLALKSEALYRGQWLPEPGSALEQVDGLSTKREAERQGLFAVILAIAGVVAFLVPAVFRAYAAASTPLASVPFALIAVPLAVAATMILLIHWDKRRTVDAVREAKETIGRSFSDFMPVYQDRAGVAMLISEMLSYGETMREEVKSFSEISSRIADGDFAEGIKEGVRTVMSDEVAPTIRASGETLSALAKTLTEKQERGMTDLAQAFSDRVSQVLSDHLSDLTNEIGQIRKMATETQTMMNESVATLIQAREDNRELNKELHEVLRLMALAKNDMANELVALRDNLELIGVSSDKLTALFAGGQEGLSDQLTRLSDQMRLNTDILNRSISESSKTMDASVHLAGEQTRQTESLLQHLDLQIQTLDRLTHELREQTSAFTDESAAYVRRTLDDYDAGLAEVVERLSFTTSEIREAIDALPAAIRSAGKFQEH